MPKLTVSEIRNRKYPEPRMSVMICESSGCLANGGDMVREAFVTELEKRGLGGDVKTFTTGCYGFCTEGPIVSVQPEGVLYVKVKPENVAKIVDDYIVGGKPPENFLYKEPGKPTRIARMSEIPFFKNQSLRILRHKGRIAAGDIDSYMANDGYLAITRALTEMKPEDVIKLVKQSGLRGMGGVGFPVGLRWEIISRAQSEVKYVICNGDKGDPSAFIDRSILEADTHAVIEGVMLGLYAIGANKGYIYVKDENTLAIERLERAIGQARDYGLLGDDVLGSGRTLDVEVFQGAGAFVCSETTALMRAIEGSRGMPRSIPPNPFLRGLWDKPTLLNNVETFACIAQIVHNGPNWFREVGTEKCPGTKVFAVAGGVNNTGLVEVPMGTTLRHIIDNIAGGIKKGRTLKAVHTGGPLGGTLPESLLDTPITFEDMAGTGAAIGSGGLVVLDDLNCIVQMTKFYMEFITDESCGKCPPCRVGTMVLLEMLSDIVDGKGKAEYLDLLDDLSRDVRETSLCSFGQSAPNVVLTTLRYFRQEYEEHINQGFCRAGVCKELITFEIDEDACKACGACLRACPVKAVSGEKKLPHLIDQALCVKCRSCFDACKFNAVRIGPASIKNELLNKQPAALERRAQAKAKLEAEAAAKAASGAQQSPPAEIQG